MFNLLLITLLIGFMYVHYICHKTEINNSFSYFYLHLIFVKSEIVSIKKNNKYMLFLDDIYLLDLNIRYVEKLILKHNKKNIEEIYQIFSDLDDKIKYIKKNMKNTKNTKNTIDIKGEYLKLFNLRENFSRIELRTQYRMLVKKYHPDLNNGDDKIFKKVQEAYSYLNNLIKC